jgi:hypothetical protein
MAVVRTAIATGALIFALGATAAPVAADVGENPSWRAACERDALVHCRLHALAFDIPGVRDCLIRNLNKVSDACRGVIKAAQAEHTQTPVAVAPH